MAKEIKDPRNIMLFPHGGTAAFDFNGAQIPELQQSWLLTYVRNVLEPAGVDPTEVDFELPSGRIAKVFKTEDGLNWQIT